MQKLMSNHYVALHYISINSRYMMLFDQDKHERLHCDNSGRVSGRLQARADARNPKVRAAVRLRIAIRRKRSGVPAGS
jgi:hypothetical protein